MDLNVTPEEQQFRDELRSWLKANLPEPWPASHRRGESDPEFWQYLRDWQKTLFDGGWAGIAWPKDVGGRGATVIEQSIFLEELTLAEAPDRVGVIGEGIVGPTIMAVGTDEQKQKFLPRILSGEHVWCQGFSEPNAGSDVAASTTKAVRDGDDFVINGQKIWTSFAHIADWNLLLVRTSTDGRKHEGLTMLLVDMQTPGINVRPLRQMSGDSGFNEVFFSDVRVPATNTLGEVDAGWSVAIAALMNERANLGAGMYVIFKRNLKALIEQTKQLKKNGVPASQDPLVRQKLAQAAMEVEIFRLNADRALTRMSKSAVPGPEGSILKVYWSEMNQRFNRTAMEILGDYGQLEDYDDGKWSYGYLRARGNTIEAGTTEVQRNILAQRVLGLPRSY